MLFSVLASMVIAAPAQPYPMILSYSNQFSIQYDCLERSAIRFQYKLDYDFGSIPRPKRFYKDSKLSKECQQWSTDAYGKGYDRGHLVTSNHMDGSESSIRESHYMVNIVPQVSTFNQGIWQDTEEITDCYRDINPIEIFGGVIYTDTSNDYFVESHGIRTPDFFWKVLVTKDSNGKDKIISWFFPNKENLGDLDDYITSVDEIESKLNDNLGEIPVKSELKKFKASRSWAIPFNCNRS
jgi:endonuclease G